MAIRNLSPDFQLSTFNFQLNRLGFTLIELLVAVSISGVLMAVGISAYSKGQKREQLKDATGEIMSNLQEAQKQSTIGKKDCAGTFEGITLTSQSGTSNIVLQPQCDSGSGTGKTSIVQSATFTNSIDITFLPLGQGIDTGGSYVDLQYDVRGTTYTIRIYQTGNFEYLGET